MVKESITDLGLTPFAVLGLLVFFGVFVAVAVWTMTRRKKQIATWSSLPLADGVQPLEPRHHHAGDHECKNCGGCDCSNHRDKNIVTIH